MERVGQVRRVRLRVRVRVWVKFLTCMITEYTVIPNRKVGGLGSPHADVVDPTRGGGSRVRTDLAPVLKLRARLVGARQQRGGNGRCTPCPQHALVVAHAPVHR